MHTASNDIPPLTLEESLDEEYEIACVTQEAFDAILDVEQARQDAQLAEEIALSLNELDHRDDCDQVAHYTLLYTSDDTEDFPIPPLELPDPQSAKLVVEVLRKWSAPACCLDYNRGHDYDYDPDRDYLEEYVDQLDQQEFNEEDYNIVGYSRYGRSLEISFRRYSDYLRAEALRLWLRSHKLEHVSGTLPVPQNMTVIGMRQALSGSDREDAELVTQVFAGALSKYVVLESAWRIDNYTRHVDHKNKPFRQSYQNLIAVASFKQKPNSNGELYKATDLPGWVDTTRHKLFPLDVMGRHESCMKCTCYPMEGTYGFHTEEQGTRTGIDSSLVNGTCANVSRKGW